jgi:RNA ligase
MTIHPAHTIPFDELVSRLKAARDQRVVYERHGPGGLTLYVYTERCVYDGLWDLATISARGLIVDHAARKIVATPFPKFFNLGERDGTAPDLPFEVTEKLDGSLIIIFHHGNAWRTATKGAFDSPQAVWAREHLGTRDLAALQPGTTYLAEATYPENRIVVHHDTAALRLLAAYNAGGLELPMAHIEQIAMATGMPAARRHSFGSLAELMKITKTLPKSEEGFVLRFENGLRLKVKGDEYKRIHALISRVTPLAMWEAMAANSDLESIRRDLPEEFWGDFDDIIAIINGQIEATTAVVRDVAKSVEHLSDKELGLSLATLDKRAQPYVFDWRKSGGKLGPRSMATMFRGVRPTGNVLEGYTPSFAVNRVQDDNG